ncbi:HAMP domain-containing sensor histidine kinase [Alicyclobacillus cellulosilyticus]|uniref:HAMP domain-containing sensor histidine kinase n=1 Tax=Alicyclobacillus cellulosilyticus TaxID=1003997 RepID=UPI001E4DCE57|nr:HAMP domain-containing sensor histidine kinase [Alicyclobacillus cellulosilyticus]
MLALALILQAEVRRHFFMVVCPQVHAVSPPLTQLIQGHFEQALSQSLVWTLLCFVLAAAGMAVMVSRVMTRRIVIMQKHAARIAQGEWGAAMPVAGRDELSSLANTLNYLSEQLARQEQLRKHLMQDIAHELRTPLATLRAHLQAFYDGLWEPNRERLQSCLEEIERFEALVAAVETLYEADTMSEVPSRSGAQTDLRQAAQSVVQLFEPRCAAAGLNLAFVAEDTPVWVQMEAKHVAQVLWNLLDNAVKYTPRGGSISVSVGHRNGRPFLAVKDTGIGIPESELENIFERFYRVDKSRDRKTGGSGLGLAIVKRLVDSSHGVIQVESQVGVGSNFTIHWPAPFSSASSDPRGSAVE